ncbi:MAG TPA: flagellar basal body L-ring protein FlgH [Verrucomicrobiae bacterium]|jgi:flagellar L-ring protein precursor FlgH|nr:flagellar basal body L-ring protein FlgH [Verrucomicrobiae bacterium]
MNTKSAVKNLFVVAALAVLLVPALGIGQSLWCDGTSKSIFSDKRSLNVGDILTIAISESSTANKNNATSTQRKSSLSAAITAFLYPAGATPLLTKSGTLPAMAYNSDHTHNGSGTISDSETIVAQIAVRILDVLPNGNLVVEGKRETSFSNENQTIVLRGVVRPEDVLSNNTVFSYNVADATIQIIGKGTVSDSQNKGWFNRIWDKINPF